MRSKLVVFVAFVLLLGTTMAVIKTVGAIDTPSFAFKTPMLTARGQAAVITGDDGLIYVIGGFNASSVFDVVEAYNPSTNSWTTKASLLNATRGPAVAKGLDGKVYVFGGYDASVLDTVQVYDPLSNSWELKTSLPTAVWMAGAATGNDGRIYVVGGEDWMTNDINTLQIYNSESDMWATGPSMPTGRSLLGVAKGPDGRIYAFGGWAGSFAQDDIFVYDPVLEEWTSTFTGLPMPVARLEFGMTLGPDGKFYLVGGGTNYGNNSPPVFDRVDSFDPNVMLGWEFEGLMPIARKELGAATGLNGKIYIIGGSNGTHYVDTNVEMTVVENQKPQAYVDSITPNPSTRDETITFTGHGTDVDGSVMAYKWRSSINGTIGTTATFETTTLGLGTHTIYFSVKDNGGAWSEETMTVVTVNVPIDEDPTHQRVSELEQQNAELSNKVDELSVTIDNLNTKLDMMALELLGAGIITLILVVVAIALVYMTRSKRTSPVQATL